MKQIFPVHFLKLFVLPVLLFSFYCVQAQQQDNDYKRKVPPFHIQLANGDSLVSKQLKKNVRVMVVYFDPKAKKIFALETVLRERKIHTSVLKSGSF